LTSFKINDNLYAQLIRLSVEVGKKIPSLCRNGNAPTKGSVTKCHFCQFPKNSASKLKKFFSIAQLNFKICF